MKKQWKWAAAVMAACVLCGGTASAKEYTTTINGTAQNIYSDVRTLSDDKKTYNYTFAEGDTLTVTGTGHDTHGVQGAYSGGKNVNIETALDISVSGTYEYGTFVTGVFGSDYKTITLAGGNISASSTATEKNSSYDNARYTEAFGLFADYLGTVNYNGSGTISATAKGYYSDEEADKYDSVTAVGANAYGGTLHVESGTIKAEASGGAYNYATGVSAQDGTGDYQSYTPSKVTLGVVDITVTGGEEYSYLRGIYAEGSSTVDMKGGSIKLEAANQENTSGYAIYADGEAVVNVNYDKDEGVGSEKVTIDGNIFTYGDSESEKAKINLALTTKDSYLNGSSRIIYGDIGITLNDGATWYQHDYWNSGKEANSVTTLSMDGGIIQRNENSATLAVGTYSGNGTVVLDGDVTDGVFTPGVTGTSGTNTMTITEAKPDSSISIISTKGGEIDTNDATRAGESLSAMAETLAYKGTEGNLTATISIEEGIITRSADATLAFDKTTGKASLASVTYGREAPTITAIKSASVAAILGWREEDATLSQRLGDLRKTDGGQGLWTRYSRGEFEYAGALKNQYDFFQLGYDFAKGDWHYGAAVSHNKGESAFESGRGENRSTSLSLYATKAAATGEYTDLVVKAGRISNEYDVTAKQGASSADYDVWGVAVSGEYGRKFENESGWYVTPLGKLTLMRVGNEKYMTSSGIAVEQRALSSAVGRLGFEAGKEMGRAAFYAKASLLHEFAGDAETVFQYQGITTTAEASLGSTWWEAGFGANLSLSDAGYLYADFVKTYGDDFKTPWQWNVGVRFGF